MTPAAQAGTAAGVLVAVLAGASLWRGSQRHGGSVRHACRLFLAAALLWGVGEILQQALAGPATGVGMLLTFADLPTLLALLLAATGLVIMGMTASGERPARPGPAAVGARLADGCVLAGGLFLIGWVTVLGADYLRAGEGPAPFTLELIHPLADLVVLGATLRLAAAAGRRGWLAWLALLAVAVSDALDLRSRLAGVPAGIGPQFALIAGLCLLALVPWADGYPAGLGGVPGRGAAGRPASGGVAPVVPEPFPAPLAPSVEVTVAMSLTAALAALVVIAGALRGAVVFQPVVAFVGAMVVLALVLRVISQAWQVAAAARLRQGASRQFRELADRTSDVVLVCDMEGIIRYASPAVADYGYSPEVLQGSMLTDLLHPEDRSTLTRTAREVAIAGTEPNGRYPCRVRAADGTWRHVESTVSRHRNTGGGDQLLVTARDVSDQVALRRHVTHLTSHDGLTGLPNRAYVEDRAWGARHTATARTAAGSDDRAGGVIFLDLDDFSAVNEASGHAAGDLLLAQVARRLRAEVPPRDTVARWGGDEFAVLVEGAVGTQEIIELAQRLAAVIEEDRFRVGDTEFPVTASVGVAVWAGDAGGYIWRNAEMAMARAKEAGGGRVEVYGAGPPRMPSETARADTV